MSFSKKMEKGSALQSICGVAYTYYLFQIKNEKKTSEQIGEYTIPEGIISFSFAKSPFLA